MKQFKLGALAVAAVLSSFLPAGAADLGGNCCADLEERIAELEATTVRKGNRKVSLTISGWVSQQVSVWDDGVETNAYVSDIGATLNSNFKLTGSAKITPDLSAGYLLQIEAVGNENLALFQSVSATGKGLAVIQSFWFVKSETFGKLSVGTQSSAADNAAILPDSSGSLVVANYIMYDINRFLMRRNGVLQNFAWGELASCQAQDSSTGFALGLGADCDGVPNNNIRYDTPTFAGFSASASWGEDDIWAVSGRYAGEFSGFKLAAAVGYFDTTDDNAAGEASVRARGGKKASALQAGAYVQHIPTGLFAYGAYGHDYNDRTGALSAAGQQKDAENYYVKAGIRQKWLPYGATVVYGEYGVNKDKLDNFLWINGATGSNLTQWGVGLVQEVDAAAMSLFINYRHYEADLTCANAGGSGCATVGKNSFDDAQLVKAGAIINF